MITPKKYTVNMFGLNDLKSIAMMNVPACSLPALNIVEQCDDAKILSTNISKVQALILFQSFIKVEKYIRLNF